MKQVLGWREWVSLPTLGIDAIKAKTDTGARTSALHAYDVEIDGGEVLFKVPTVQQQTGHIVRCRAPLLGHRLVRSSTGRQSLRSVIETELEVLGERWPIELTLAPRDLMGFRMLLGRQALRGRFLIDPRASYLGNEPPRQRGKDHGR